MRASVYNDPKCNSETSPSFFSSIGSRAQQWKIFAHFRRTPVPTYRLGQGYSWPLTVLRANCLFVRTKGKFDLQPQGGNFVRNVSIFYAFTCAPNCLELVRILGSGSIFAHWMHQLCSVKAGSRSFTYGFSKQCEFCDSRFGSDRQPDFACLEFRNCSPSDHETDRFRFSVRDYRPF